MLTIYGRPNSSNVRKVLWFMGEVGIEHERLDYGRGFTPTDTPEYLAMNPNALIPTMVDGDTVLWESNTIMRYLAVKHGHTAWYPEDLARRATVQQWMDWQLSVLAPGIMPLFLGGHLDLPPANTPERIADSHTLTTAAMGLLADQLAKTGAYVAGPDLSLADCAIAMYVHRWYALDIERVDLPPLADYYARLQDRAPFKTIIVDAGV